MDACRMHATRQGPSYPRLERVVAALPALDAEPVPLGALHLRVCSPTNRRQIRHIHCHTQWMNPRTFHPSVDCRWRAAASVLPLCTRISASMTMSCIVCNIINTSGNRPHGVFRPTCQRHHLVVDGRWCIAGIERGTWALSCVYVAN